MTKTYSIAEAKENLSELVHEVESGSCVELTRKGKPVAMLIGIEEYGRLAPGRRDFWEAYEEFRSEFDLMSLGIDPQERLGDIRESSPGRGFSW